MPQPNKNNYSTEWIFFTNKLGYDVITIKNIVDYGVKMNILKVVENDKDFESSIVVKSDELNEIDWSISNNRYEIYYNDFDYFRKKLFVSNPKIPHEFKCFIIG